MLTAQSSARPSPGREPLAQLRVWHLSLLVLYAAIAIADIQHQHLAEPALAALAASGFAGYALLAWLGWRAACRFAARIGLLPVTILYLVAMAALFLLATIIYLAIEHAYHVGLW
jgi:hypothetical protein